MLRNIFLSSIILTSFYNAEAQIIQNKNFKIFDNVNTFKNWEFITPGYTISQEKDPANNSSYVLKMEKTGNGQAGAFSQKINYTPASQLEKYIISGYIKTENVNTAFAAIVVRVFDKNGYKLSLRSPQAHSVK